MAPLHRFARYSLVGLANTAVHASIFLGLHWVSGLPQTGSHLTGFLAAASLSFCLNAHFTFQTCRSWHRYWVFMAFMALLSLVIGYLFCRRVVFAAGQS